MWISFIMGTCLTINPFKITLCKGSVVMYKVFHYLFDSRVSSAVLEQLRVDSNHCQQPVSLQAPNTV